MKLIITYPHKLTKEVRNKILIEVLAFLKHEGNDVLVLDGGFEVIVLDEPDEES